MRVAWCCTLLALCGALLVQGTPLPAAKADAAQPAAAATPEEDVDGQVSAVIQEVEKQQNDESPREKRAGAGGSFLNDLNQGPTYSQLLGQSGGGFNKLGILSGLLGSSSGGGAAGGGDAAGASGSGSGSILSLITPLLGSSSGPNVASLVDLGLLGLNLALPGGDGASGNPPPAAGADEAGSPDLEDAGSEDDVIAVTALNVIEDSSSGGGAGASAGASVSLGGGVDGGDIGASAGASIDGDTTGGAGAAGAGAGAGSDSGSILSLVTPLLGSSSQGSGGDGSASGGGNPATAGTFGGGFLGTILSAVFSIKSFIFRKIVQLLTSSSGSPQAG